jgi:glutamate-1-semialdehyde 2,1-aminomutase
MLGRIGLHAFAAISRLNKLNLLLSTFPIMENLTLTVSNDSEGVEQNLAIKISTYINENPKSKEALQNALPALASGTTRSVLSYDPFPLFFTGGRDAILTSVDGHEYLDFVSEYCAGLFGHSNPEIKAAIQTVIESGFTLGGPNLREGELAKLLVSRFASMDAIRFCNSGTEANTMAIATALAYNGRKKVILIEVDSDPHSLRYFSLI